ncbi:hypothetical protein E2C01_050443 [Portunus trituberculatus]|uniref:Uncharacterized protein n=1 Tax=Portunus trituberculatus TaxID=210409 RepID=A0A5B7GC42_PORTR|nr:hypothetical protein [Portunus trituberculatus]
MRMLTGNEGGGGGSREGMLMMEEDSRSGGVVVVEVQERKVEVRGAVEAWQVEKGKAQDSVKRHVTRRKGHLSAERRAGVGRDKRSNKSTAQRKANTVQERN